jgi:hypothetical protein
LPLGVCVTWNPAERQVGAVELGEAHREAFTLETAELVTLARVGAADRGVERDHGLGSRSAAGRIHSARLCGSTRNWPRSPARQARTSPARAARRIVFSL